MDRFTEKLAKAGVVGVDTSVFIYLALPLTAKNPDILLQQDVGILPIRDHRFLQRYYFALT